ncbi:MAG: hypothetical protein ACP5UZ_08615 [Thermoplasmata archaeon]
MKLGNGEIVINMDNNSKQNAEKSHPSSVQGNVVIDSASGAIDLIGAIEIELRDIECPENLIIADFDTKPGEDVKEPVFLHRDIYLLDKENLSKLIKGDPFNCHVYFVDEGWINHQVVLGHFMNPAMPPPLRDSMLACYAFLSGKNIEDIGYGYDIFGAQPVENLRHFERAQERTKKQSYATHTNLDFHYWLVLIQSTDFEERSGMTWNEYIKRMFEVVPKEVGKIAERFVAQIERKGFETYSQLPEFTEHYCWHPANIILF